MSTALAIGATTAVLTTVIHNAVVAANLSGPLGTPAVSAIPPDRVPTGADEISQLNLFMYQATANAGWRNVDMPLRTADGMRTSHNRMAVDLHYLLCAYGADDFHAEMLLGIGMEVLHELSVIPRDIIRDVFTPTAGGALSSTMQALSTAGLADQVETIKICPYTLNTEELSRLWGAFQDKYRPSAAYQASVVLIESRGTFRSAPPVTRRNVYVLPFRQPSIEELEPRVVATPGSNLTIRGVNLRGPLTEVRFGSGEEQAPLADVSSDTALVVTLPTTLRAGVNTAQVLQRLMIGPPTLHRGFESNVDAFVLRPSISNLQVVAPTGTTPRRISLDVAPAIGKRQRVELLMNVLNPPTSAAALGFTFEAAARDVPGALDQVTSVTIDIPDVPGGTYLVRLRVDGAESALTSAPSGQFTGPTVTF